MFSVLVLSTTGLCPLWFYFLTYGNFLKTVTQNIHRFSALNLLWEIAKARGKNSSYSILVIKLKHKRRKSLWDGRQILKCFHWVHSYSRVVSLWVLIPQKVKEKSFKNIKGIGHLQKDDYYSHWSCYQHR